jgi:hypothetical protein
MTDFNSLEEIALRIKRNRQQLSSIEDELSKVNAKMHELPRKSETESAFAKMIGMEYHNELDDLEKERERLAAEKEVLASTVANDLSTFMNELTSPDLTIPLEPVPKFTDGNAIYSYRNNAKFSSVFEILSELLGLSVPLVIKDVMLSPSEIVIKAKEEFEAKRKFINSINEVQKTLSIKKH